MASVLSLRPWLAAALTAAACQAGAATLGSELLINGDAEAGALTGWTSGGVAVVASAEPGTLGLPAGTATGDWSFAYGSGPASTQGLRQQVDVSSWSSLIDAGQGIVEFSVLLQSRTPSSVAAYLRFLDEDGQALIVSPAFDTQDAPGIYDWEPAFISAAAPVGTRALEVFLVFQQLGLTNAYADNASLMLLSAVPEPGSAALLGAGLLWLARRRRQPG